MRRFKYAIEGCYTILRKDRHFLYHIVVTCFVIILGWWLSLSMTEWLFIVLSIFLVLISEALNTAIEYVVDMTTEEFHLYAKYAKDIAAFSVLLAALFALITGSTILIPKLISML
ncbi:diacylglycerol kinase family protein [Staphylococcus lutrae]|uniref:Diacylglycerol kinase n=1 Tax=Staphylococcus lutrae TaxID=155085 RepID=A0AAC9RMR9_9STAP|nr:diacylglycerol kinase family protein [Staphylococcus lutrae]ARJ49881.1 diacylglycerol kinase [Staphylococcus lutrae]PNZ37756.1 diacylglycerol kinase [Staphylococcus lutrae]